MKYIEELPKDLDKEIEAEVLKDIKAEIEKDRRLKGGNKIFGVPHPLGKIDKEKDKGE